MERGDLTGAEADYCFRRATCAYSGAEERWAERSSRPMSDGEVIEALKMELSGDGSGGGSFDKPWYGCQANGLKIWGGWKYPNPCTTAPLWKGVETVRKARAFFRIPAPDDNAQLCLFQ